MWSAHGKRRRQRGRGGMRCAHGKRKCGWRDHDGGDINAAFVAITGEIDGDVNTNYAILSGDIDGDFSGKRTIVTDAQSIPWEAILSAVIERDVDKLRQYFAK